MFEQINTKPAYSFIRRLSEIVLVYTALDFMLEADSKVVVGLTAFALLWVATDLAIWIHHNFIQPSAQAVIKNHK